MKFKVGDKVRIVKGTTAFARSHLGYLGEITKIEPGNHGFADVGDGYYILDYKNEKCVWEVDVELVSSSNNQKPMTQKISAIAKKLLDGDTKTLIKAGFIDNNLDLTDKGTAALNAIVFEQNKAALVEAAKAEVEEAKQ